MSADIPEVLQTAASCTSAFHSVPLAWRRRSVTGREQPVMESGRAALSAAAMSPATPPAPPAQTAMSLMQTLAGACGESALAADIAALIERKQHTVNLTRTTTGTYLSTVPAAVGSAHSTMSNRI
jgi:hypothetical protein